MQQIGTKVLVGLCLLIFLSGPLLAATPQITNVTGSIASGQTVTITGSNLVNENKTNWDPFFLSYPNASSFEGGSPSDDGYGQISFNGGVYDRSVKILGNQSIKFHIQGASGNCPVGNLYDDNGVNPVGGNGNDVWIRGYVRWRATGGWPASHIKMLDCVGDANYGVQYYLQPTAGTTLPNTMTGRWDDNALHYANIPSGQLQNDRWYCIEAHWKTTAPYRYEAWMDGVKLYDANPTVPGALDMILFGIINACETPSSFSLDHWWDGFVVSKSRVYPASKIEIGNSPTYGQGSEKWQEAVYLSESSIQFKANLSGLGSGPYYIWVTNNGQTRSAGYMVTSGSGTGGSAPQPDTTAPSTPTNLKAIVASSSQINLTWTASTDNVGVSGYRIYRGGVQIATTAGTSYQNTALVASTTYSYSVAAYDAAGNQSGQCSAVSATTASSGTSSGGGSSDTTAPTVPANFKATVVSSSQINLRWTASTDNVGVTGYRIYRNGKLLVSGLGTAHHDEGLAPSTTYTYTIAAYDAAGNVSAQSAPVSATTLASGGRSTSDRIAPTVPSNVKATVVSSSQINLMWTASTDNVGVTGYRVYRNGKLLVSGLGTAHQDESLAPSTTYTYTIAAYDAAGNVSAQSVPVSATTSSSGSAAALLFEERFEDNNLAVRGWFDNTIVTLSTTEHVTGSTRSLEFRFPQGATTPINGHSIRKVMPDTDRIYVSYYVKYSSNWQGSNKSYHPHEFMILSNKDNEWDGLAYNYLTTYIEQNEGEPLIGIQDGKNIDRSRLNTNLTGITEFRAVAGCNGDSDGYGNGACYPSGSVYWNGKTWRSGSIYFRDSSWHFVEAYIKMNSIVSGKGAADGEVSLWFDGAPIMSHKNVMIRTAANPDLKFRTFVIAPYIGDGSPVDQTFWIDNLKVATGR